MWKWKWKSFSRVWLFATLWTVQSMEFSRQEYWSGWPFPSSRDLPNPGIEPRSTTLQVDSLPAEPQEKPKNTAASSISLLQRIFPTQESNWDLLYCGKILYQLSFQGSHQELNKQLKKILTIEQLALASLYHWYKHNRALSFPIGFPPMVRSDVEWDTSVQSVQLLSHVQLFATPWTAACQVSLSITSPRACSNSCPLSQWCHPTISSVVPFCSWLQSFPASGSFRMSQFFTSGGQSIGASALASVLPMNVQDWFPLGWTGWISLQSKGLSRVFSNTTVQKQ